MVVHVSRGLPWARATVASRGHDSACHSEMLRLFIHGNFIHGNVVIVQRLVVQGAQRCIDLGPVAFAASRVESEEADGNAAG